MTDTFDLYLDTETYCEVNLNTCGTHRYAEEVEIMLWQWAIDDGPVNVWDATDDSEMPDELMTILAFGEHEGRKLDWVVMHKSDFDRTMLRHGAKINIPTSMIWDTMAQARAHGLPGSLQKLCEIFQVPETQAKDKAGRQLIQLFCKPRPANSKIRRATRATHPVEWSRFLSYAGSDIEAMRWLRKNMPRWNYPDREHELWQLDQRINDRGFAVDLDLARASIAAVDRAKRAKDNATGDLTHGDVTSTTQRDRLLKHLVNEWGVDLPDMTSTTLERRILDPDLPWVVRELLAIRLQVSTTSNAKYNTLLRAVSTDGRLRGSLNFCGAPRTTRWSGVLFQAQNLVRPDMSQEDIAFGIEALKTESAHFFFDNVMRVASNALRGLIVAGPGRKIVASDLAQIESRVLNWLAGEQWKLDAYQAIDDGTGEDIYRQTAGRMLFKDPAEVTKFERQSHGKVPELSCGYGGSVGALTATALLYNFELGHSEKYEMVRSWRELHPAIADWEDGFWAKLDRAARLAVANPGKVFAAGEHIGFERWRNWLKMHLPSGKFLSYAHPAIIADEQFGGTTLSFMGINSYTKRWERLKTYGGKLSADATQKTARDILAHNLPAIEGAGFPPVLLVHDEVVTEPLDDPEYSVHKLNSLLARRPPWLTGMPIRAEGFEAYRYRKDD